MKRIVLKYIIAITIAISISSCAAIHSGYLSNSVALNSANFSYVKQNIKGEATAVYVLFIGGLAKETLVDEAKQQMLASSPLMNNQALANTTVNFKTSCFLGIIWTVNCTVTADVVEFK